MLENNNWKTEYLKSIFNHQINQISDEMKITDSTRNNASLVFFITTFLFFVIFKIEYNTLYFINYLVIFFGWIFLIMHSQTIKNGIDLKSYAHLIYHEYYKDKDEEFFYKGVIDTAQKTLINIKKENKSFIIKKDIFNSICFVTIILTLLSLIVRISL